MKIKGKLVKVSTLPPIIVKEAVAVRGMDGKEGKDGKIGETGKAGIEGKAGRDAPTLEEIVKALNSSPELLKAIQVELGKQTLGDRGGGGGSSFSPPDLPGYKGALPGQIFGVGADKKVGFFEPLTLGITGGEEVPYTRLIDTVGNYKYIGEATPGTATSSALWRIKRVEFLAGDDIEIKWANGTSTEDRVWTNRASETYS